MSTHHSIHGFTVTKDGRARVRHVTHRPGLDPKSPKQIAAALNTNKQLAILEEKRLNESGLKHVTSYTIK
jgi:hypothetical protein